MHIFFCQSAVTERLVHGGKKKQLQALSINFVMCTEKGTCVVGVQEVTHMCCGMMKWTYTTQQIETHLVLENIYVT